MGRDETQFLVFHPFFKRNDIFCHFPDFFDASAALDVKRIKDILRFRADRVLICDIISDGPHFLPVKLLCIQVHPSVQVGLINVEIHHARVRPADLGDIRVTESPSRLRGTAPVFDLCLDSRISALHNAGDHRMSLTIPFKVSHHLAYSAARIALSEPRRDICVVIVQSFQLLDIHEHDRHIQVLHSREHVVGRSVCKELKEHQIHVRRAEQVARCLGLLFCRHHPAVDDLHRIRDRLLKCLILRLKLRHKRRELRKVRA